MARLPAVAHLHRAVGPATMVVSAVVVVVALGVGMISAVHTETEMTTVVTASVTSLLAHALMASHCLPSLVVVAVVAVDGVVVVGAVGTVGNRPFERLIASDGVSRH